MILFHQQDLTKVEMVTVCSPISSSRAFVRDFRLHYDPYKIPYCAKSTSVVFSIRSCGFR
jgi:hypothetical protein